MNLILHSACLNYHIMFDYDINGFCVNDVKPDTDLTSELELLLTLIVCFSFSKIGSVVIVYCCCMLLDL